MAMERWEGPGDGGGQGAREKAAERVMMSDQLVERDRKWNNVPRGAHSDVSLGYWAVIEALRLIRAYLHRGRGRGQAQRH